MFAAVGLAVVLQAPPAQAPSPYSLALGRPGTTVAQSGRITALPGGGAATPDDIAKAADGKRFVFLGEQHATPAHQQMQALILDALARRGRKVVVGLEMLQRPKQSVLDAFAAGKLDEAAFREQADWKGQWGYDFSFYRPVFDIAFRHKMPVVGLNVPRDWVRAVGRGGLAALPAEAKADLPTDIDPKVPDHQKVFEALMGGHPVSGTQGENMLAAQSIWDIGMADTAVKYLEKNRADRRTVFVVIAGAGHVMYGQGINLRLARRKAGEGITVVMTESTEPITAANGLGDFLYVSPAPRK
ncbi:MAG: ChaN family lipoprotein [Fimbriimonas sp.]